MEKLTKKLIIFLAVVILPNITKIRRIIYAVSSISVTFVTLLFGFGMESSALFKLFVCIPIFLINLIVLTASFSNVGITELMRELNSEENINNPNN
jgi:hypothetical protein